MPFNVFREQTETFESAPVQFTERLLQEADAICKNHKYNCLKYLATFDAHEVPDMFSSFNYRKVAEFHHAHLRYDYDDAYPKFKSVVYRQFSW